MNVLIEYEYNVYMFKMFRIDFWHSLSLKERKMGKTIVQHCIFSNNTYSKIFNLKQFFFYKIKLGFKHPRIHKKGSHFFSISYR